MRDNLAHQLAIRAFPNLPAQDYKYSVLYINGQYWGVYNIREAHSTTHYAEHYGYDVDTVTQWKEKWDGAGPMAEILSFALSHNLANEENYAKVAERLHIDSIIGWTIMEAYTGNFDSNPPNMRFYYSTADNKMAYAPSRGHSRKGPDRLQKISVPTTTTLSQNCMTFMYKASTIMACG